MSNPQVGAFGLPGIDATRTNVESEIWWGRFEQQLFQPAVIDSAAVDAGNTGNTTRLRPGLLLGRITSTGKLKEWNPTGTDGSEFAVGILVSDQYMQTFGTAADRWVGQFIVSGNLKATTVIVPGETTAGLSGNANEHIIRAQLGRQFLFDDDLNGNGGMFGFNNVAVKTGDYTVLESDNGTLFNNRGAVGAVEFTLPVTAEKGLTYGFYVVADQTLKIIAGTADTLIVFNDPTADSVSLETAGDKVGGMFVVIGDGTGWMTMPILWGADGVLVQTATIAT